MQKELALMSACCLVLSLVLFFGLGHRDLGLWFLGMTILCGQWVGLSRRDP